MYKYIFLFYVLLGMLSNFAGEMRALAADGDMRLSRSPWVNFDQITATAPWSAYLTGPHEMFLPYAASETGESHSGGGHRWEGPPAEIPEWRGLTLDTGYFAAYQFLAIGILYMAPESFSGWTQEDKDNYSFSRWKENVSNPIWDDDAWYVNYILHPYWGATFYIRARERGLKRMQSFWYAVLLSTIYEFGAEALFEPVSYQDLIVTPVAGALLGEFLFTPVREWVRAKPGQLAWSGKAVLLITDPLGVANETLNMIFGVNTEMSFCRLRMENIPRLSGEPGETQNTLSARVRINPTWGLQLKINW
jgi:hypothetical protein